MKKTLALRFKCDVILIQEALLLLTDKVYSPEEIDQEFIYTNITEIDLGDIPNPEGQGMLLAFICFIIANQKQLKTNKN